MSRTSLAGAAALLAAPALAIVGTLVQPTLSDDASKQVAALTDHRAATITGIALQAIAITLLIGGVIRLALTLAPRAERWATAGGILAVLGSLIVLFENGIAAAAPSVVRGLDPTAATAALDRIQSSTAVSALEPLSLLGDIGLALLAIGAVKVGVSRIAAAAIIVGAFGEGIGFGSGTKPLVVVAFAILLIGLVQLVRTLVEARSTAWEFAGSPATSPAHAP